MVNYNYMSKFTFHTIQLIYIGDSYADSLDEEQLYSLGEAMASTICEVSIKYMATASHQACTCM